MRDWKTKNKKSLDFSRMKNKVVTNVEKDYMDKYRNIIKELRRDDGFGTARRGSDEADQVSLIKMK